MCFTIVLLRGKAGAPTPKPLGRAQSRCFARTTYNECEASDIPAVSLGNAILQAMAEGEIVVTVEIPRGSRNKYEFDPELGAIFLDRRLFTSTVYPADYGFVDGTLAGDGDALD